MKKLGLCSIVLLASFALVFGLSGNAQALSLTTDLDPNATACVDGPAGEQHYVLGVEVFGHSDWVQLAKKNTPDGALEGEEIGLWVLPDDVEASTGTFGFNASTWDDYGQIFAVLKDGVGVGDIYWFGYLLPTDISTFTWTYPGGKDLSYLAIYVREGTSIPDASVMLLLGSSFLVLAVFSKKRKTI